MSDSIFIPPPTKFTKKCDRCGLLYDENEQECTHCAGLSDEDVLKLKEAIEIESQSNKNLGMLFIFVAVILTLIFFILI